MSATWTWEPVIEPPPGGGLSLAMLDALAGDQPRSVLAGAELDDSFGSWLRGIVVGAPEGSDLHTDAVALLAAIAEHGKVRIRRD